jgi:glycerophosphoryl diester phosphodiesterase
MPGALRFEDAVGLLAGRAGLHLDLKFRSPAEAYASPGQALEVGAVARAVELVGPANVVVTTGNVRAIRAVREWSDAAGLGVRAGLSVGGSVAGRPLAEQVRMRFSELFPAPRFVESHADAVVANHWLALLGVAGFARRARLPLLVWTVDHPLLLRYWLRPGRAWMVTTNRPELALSIRGARIQP